MAFPHRAHHVVLRVQILLLEGGGLVGRPHVLLPAQLLGGLLRPRHRLDRKARLQLIRLRPVHLIALAPGRLAMLLRGVMVLGPRYKILVNLRTAQVLHLIQTEAILVMLSLLRLRLRPIQPGLTRDARPMNILAAGSHNAALPRNEAVLDHLRDIFAFAGLTRGLLNQFELLPRVVIALLLRLTF